MNDLVQDVIYWAQEKGLLNPNNRLAQMAKVTEEIGEVAKALVRNDQEELKDGIGDSFVTLIILAKQSGFEPGECLQAAYEEIAGRKGQMIDGVFVKEADLKSKYKVGDKVKVVESLYGHEFSIGEIVELTRYDDDHSWDAEGENGSFWSLMEEEFELANPKTESA